MSKENHVTTKRLFGLSFLLASIGILLISLSSATAAELKMVDGQVFQEQRSGRMWQLEQSRRLSSPEQVEEYLQEMNGSGGYTDWRLPTKQELYELLVFFDLKDNGDVAAPKKGNYWYAGESGEAEVGAWEPGDG